MKNLIFLSLCLLLNACSKPEFSSSLQKVNDGISKKTDRPLCEVDPTDYIIHPQIQSFDITSKKGLSFGFNLVSGILKAFGLKFQTTKGEVWVTTSFYSPMNYNQNLLPVQNPALVIGDKRASATGNSFEMDIDISNFKAGIDYYSKTPFSTLTKNGLVNSTGHALEQLTKVSTSWRTVVADMTSNFAIIPVGLLGGVKEGDEFVFYNVTYAWDGAPCGKFLMPVATTSLPIAKGRAIQVDTNASALEITILDTHEKIEIGSRVEILKLVQSSTLEKRSLKRSVKIIDMIPTPIPVEGSLQTIDFSIYANIQFRSMLSEYGFYIRN